MNKLVKLFLSAAVGIVLAGCYNDFDMPSPAHIYTDADFADAKILSIRELKDMFYAVYPPAGHGAVGKSLKITDNLVIRGKVISSDYANNIYKSLYILDTEVADPAENASAIELKLNTGNYIFWPVGTRVYVKLQGLVLGNYRGMLSVGIESQQSDYANNNLTGIDIKNHIRKGEQLGMSAGDTLVVNKDNYATRLTDDALGRLVRFEGLESRFGKAQWGYGNTFPNYFANSNSYDVNSPDIENENLPDSLQWRNIDKWASYAVVRDMPTPGVAFKSTPFYGSAWFAFTDAADYDPKKIPGNYVVRTSGYARFREVKVPKDGTIVDLTAIYTLYTGSYGDGTRDAYQLALNRVEDVVEVK